MGSLTLTPITFGEEPAPLRQDRCLSLFEVGPPATLVDLRAFAWHLLQAEQPSLARCPLTQQLTEKRLTSKVRSASHLPRLC